MNENHDEADNTIMRFVITHGEGDKEEIAAMAETKSGADFVVQTMQPLMQDGDVLTIRSIH